MLFSYGRWVIAACGNRGARSCHSVRVRLRNEAKDVRIVMAHRGDKRSLTRRSLVDNARFVPRNDGSLASSALLKYGHVWTKGSLNPKQFATGNGSIPRRMVFARQ